MLLLHHVTATVQKVWIPFPSQDLRRALLCSRTQALCNRVLATSRCWWAGGIVLSVVSMVMQRCLHFPRPGQWLSFAS